MQKQVHTIHFKADKDLLNFIDEKLDKLTLFSQGITNCEVYLKLEKDVHHENKLVEIKLHVPGKELFAKKHSASFEEATNHALDALKKQLIKEKELGLDG